MAVVKDSSKKESKMSAPVWALWGYGKGMGAVEGKGYGQAFTLFPCPFCAAHSPFAFPVSVGFSPYPAEK